MRKIIQMVMVGMPITNNYFSYVRIDKETLNYEIVDDLLSK